MPNKTDASFILGLKPEKAIAFLKVKKAILNKLNIESFKDSAAARATVIANISNLEMTKDIYQSMIDAREQGLTFAEWKKGLMGVFAQKGWVAGYDKTRQDYLLADPNTGEYVGTPRRLDVIYRTNMQAAYSAQRYQQLRENADNRPYWQYSAVNDSRTRPSHSAMHGLVYRYDDAFWGTFYPPNGFNCRCTVIALSERDIARKQLAVGHSESRLVPDYPRAADRQGRRSTTTAFKLPNGHVTMADKGFDYNVGRLTYRPNLDLYPEALAHQFAKQEMKSGEFTWGFKQIEKEIVQYKTQQGIERKLTADEMLVVRNQMSRQFKFAAGRLAESVQSQLNATTATVWLSDDTLIKQINSREGQDFGLIEYAYVPDIINLPKKVIPGKDYHYSFYKQFGQRYFLVVIKVLGVQKEMFIQSFRLLGEKEWNKAMKSPLGGTAKPHTL